MDEQSDTAVQQPGVPEKRRRNRPRGAGQVRDALVSDLQRDTDLHQRQLPAGDQTAGAAAPARRAKRAGTRAKNLPHVPAQRLIDDLANLDWGGLSIGQMTALFGALRQCQARGRQSLGALTRELAVAAPRAAAPEVLPPEDEDEVEAPAAEEYHAPVRLPPGMYVSDRPDPNMSNADLPVYHPSRTGSMANAAGQDAADERAVLAAQRSGRSVFN